MSWSKNIQKWETKTQRELDRTMSEYAQMATAYMQVNARWQNRTYRARHGLIAFPLRQGPLTGIVMGYNASILNDGYHYPKALETENFPQAGYLNIVTDSPVYDGAVTVFTRQIIKELRGRFA